MRPSDDELFAMERGMSPRSAGLRRWPQIRELRAKTAEGRLRWKTAAGPFRTRRAAFRYARKLRDADGIRFAPAAGAPVWAIERSTSSPKGWFVLMRCSDR
jgi:hypothetical protein